MCGNNIIEENSMGNHKKFHTIICLMYNIVLKQTILYFINVELLFLLTDGKVNKIFFFFETHFITSLDRNIRSIRSFYPTIAYSVIIYCWTAENDRINEMKKKKKTEFFSKKYFIEKRIVNKYTYSSVYTEKGIREGFAPPQNHLNAVAKLELGLRWHC